MLDLIKQKWVGRQFIDAIEYSDETGLTDYESSQLQEFMESNVGRFDVPICQVEEVKWAKCDITGLEGHCIRVDIFRDMIKMAGDNNE